MILVQIVWILMHLMLSIVGAILGLPIVGSLAAAQSWERQVSSANGKTLWQWKYRWAWPWGNLEDGITDEGSVPTRWGAFKWSGIRNKVSNLRFTPVLGFTVIPGCVRFKCTNKNLYRPGSGWSWTTQGFYGGFWWRHSSGWQFRIGWALVPEDALAFDRRDLRQVYCGFTFQLNRGG